MSETTGAGPIQSLLAEARDLVKRLEGSTVHRLAVKAGDYEIEIERDSPVTFSAPANGAGDGAAAMAAPVAGSAVGGPGIAPEARAASGAFAAIGAEADNRIAVLAPLVGTFYRQAQPGSKAFAEVGDVVEAGSTVCIVEAMKLMNEVGAGEKGRVDEILVENGDWVEFEQVLMYLEPVD